MSSIDAVLKGLADARPPTAADHLEWSQTDTAARVLDRVHDAIDAPAGRGRRSGKLVGIAATALAVGAGIAAFTVVHHRAPTVDQMVLCNQTASLTSSGAGIAVQDISRSGAIAACSKEWAKLWPDTATPEAFAACVYPATAGGDGGMVVVIPARKALTNDQSCIAAGADLIGG